MNKIFLLMLLFAMLSCLPCAAQNKPPGQVWNEGVAENAAIPRMYLMGFLAGFCDGGHDTLGRLNLDGLGVEQKLYNWIDSRCEALDNEQTMEDIIFMLDSAYRLPGFGRFTPAELLSDQYLWGLHKLPRPEMLAILAKISANLSQSSSLDGLNNHL